MAVQVQNLSKRYKSANANHAAVNDVSFQVEEGALAALLGPSGSGKSTILRLIAGLEEPNAGKIFLGGDDVTRLPPQKRGVGLVFQNYALFRQLTIRQNIAFGLEVQKAPKDRIERRIDELLELLGLNGLGERYPHQISGGQKQRVALARALAPQPKVLLLDEPFGAIDAKIRQELREWLRKLHDEVHVTSLFVTHDQEEALEICDKIFVMNKGAIEQEGKPEDIYNHPETEFVANFVGSMNIHIGRVEAGKLKMGPYVFQQSELNGFKEGDEIRIFFRPHDIYISGASKSYAMQGKITRTTFLGVTMRLEIESEAGFRFFAIIPIHIFYNEKLEEGASVTFQIEEMHYLNMRVGRPIKRMSVAGYEI